MKDLIFSTTSGSKIRRYALFPLIEKGEIVGSQIFIQSKKTKERKEFMRKSYKFYAYEVPRFDKNSCNYEQQYTYSRYMKARKAVLVETQLREMFYRMQLNIFQEKEKIVLLKRVNRMILNAIPIDYAEFINFQNFQHKHADAHSDFFRGENSRYFMPVEILEGITLLTTLYDAQYMSNRNADLLMNLLQKESDCDHEDYQRNIIKLASMKEKSSFGLSLIEYILEDNDQERLKMMLNSGLILHPKECLAMDVNMKPLAVDLLKNENLIMADEMIKCFEKCHINDLRKYFLFMYLAPYIIREEKTSEELPSFYRFFEQYETQQEETSQENISCELQLKFTQVKPYVKNSKQYYVFNRNQDMPFEQDVNFLVSQLIAIDSMQKSQKLSLINQFFSKFQKKEIQQVQFTYIDLWAFNFSNKI